VRERGRQKGFVRARRYTHTRTHSGRIIVFSRANQLRTRRSINTTESIDNVNNNNNNTLRNLPWRFALFLYYERKHLCVRVAALFANVLSFDFSNFKRTRAYARAVKTYPLRRTAAHDYVIRSR